MALVDYKGFRLIAMTKLPINSKSIRYGCSDAGQRPWYIHKDQSFDKLVTGACKKLKLKAHFCGNNFILLFFFYSIFYFYFFLFIFVLFLFCF